MTEAPTASCERPLRASSYNIYVDLPDGDDRILLVHGYSGAYDVVSRELADYVRALETRRPPKPLYGHWSPEPRPGTAGQAPAGAVDQLRRRGYLTAMDENEEEAFFCDFVEHLHAAGARSRPVFLFMTTYDCNLRCPYCFQDHMRTDERFAHLLRVMRPPMVDRIFAALPEIEARHGIGDVEASGQTFVFFGGEPLLAKARPIVEYIVEKAQARGPAEFRAITNATELDAYGDLLGPHCLSSLQITLDGPPAEHDTRRVYADGSGSFDRIAENLTLALERGVYVQVRTNVDRSNIRDLPALADEIVSRGWHDYPNFSAYTAVISPANEKTSKRTTMSSWELDKRLTEMRERHPTLRVLGRPDDGLVSGIREIVEQREDPFASFKASYCGAHGSMYVFDAFGDVYACWEHTGDSRVRIGHVEADGSIESAALQATWRRRTVASNPICRRCRFALYCGGGCAINAARESGEFFSNYCDGFAARFRAAAAEAYLAYERGTEPATTAASASATAGIC